MMEKPPTQEELLRGLELHHVEEPPANAPKTSRIGLVQKQVALQRQWAHVHPNDGMPEDMDTLLQVLPSGLSHAEQHQWYCGLLQDATRTYLVTFNTTWTKTEFREKCHQCGVPNALKVFPPDTRRSLQEALRTKSD